MTQVLRLPPAPERSLLLPLTYIVVLASILVQGLSIRPLVSHCVIAIRRSRETSTELAKQGVSGTGPKAPSVLPSAFPFRRFALLQLPHLRIATVPRQQFPMAAALDDPPAIHH